jgi:hypothetical protein
MSKGILANPRSLHFWALAAHHRRTHHHVTHATANVRAQLPVGAPPSMRVRRLSSSAWEA